MRNCGHCHTCGTKLRMVLDGEEWCDRCGAYRRYQSHGWSWAPTGDGHVSECPEPALVAEARTLDDGICSDAGGEAVMRLHEMHERYLTSHGDELPGLEIERPTPFAGCAVALILLIVAAAVVGMIALIITLPAGPWKVPLVGAGLAALWLMGRGQRM